ncbi:MAG: hypothetical protein GXO47_02305 [Chlorobi bacterium]|nr:hypothetical protein [Chlorobiota bacterium]
MISPDKLSIQTIKQSYKSVCKALEEHRIKDAFDLIAPLVKDSHNSDLIDAHYNMEFNYKSMLKYMVEGINDPERQKIYNRQLNDIYQLIDKVYDFLMTKYSYDIYYETKRKGEKNSLKEALENYSASLTSLELRKLTDPDTTFSDEEQNTVSDVFNKIWTLSETDEKELTLLRDMFASEQAPWYHKALFVSAVIMALLNHFDEKLTILLFELTQVTQEQVSARAITGLMLILYKYDARLKINDEISSRIKLLAEDDKLTGLIKTIIIQLIRTRETEKISKKLTDDIIPEVVKMQPKIKDKLDLENLISDKTGEDKNPDWQDVFEDSPELLNKLEEISQWQLEGADVFLTTFKMLKHFPFFNEIPNWLTPFYLENPAVLEALSNDDVFKSPELLEGLQDSRFLCNSDKYSLIMSIQHMPAMQKEMMGKMFGAELQQMADIEKDEKALDSNHSKLTISNQFIQDLYRLIKVHPQKNNFEDIFGWDMTFHKKWFFNILLPETETKVQIGEYFFKKNYYHEALEIFITLSEQNKPTLDLTQKIAYCYQQQNDYDNALKWYLRADFFETQTAWNKKKIALCYLHLNNPEKALEYYKEADNITPDNLHTLASIAHCLYEMKEYEEALKYYFRVEYMEPANTKVWRPIAWCSFVLGKFEQAEKYYQKLIVNKETGTDLMNLGHVLWCKGERKEALNVYQKSITAEGYSLKDFEEDFYSDTDTLIKNGINSEDLPIMLDQIRYSIEE